MQCIFVFEATQTISWRSSHSAGLRDGCDGDDNDAGDKDGGGEDGGGIGSEVLKLRLRPLSKAVYSIVLITFAIYFGVTIAPGLLFKESGSMITPYNATLDDKYNSSNCESLCPRDGFNATEIPDLTSYCNNLQYYIPDNTHYAMWITIAVLFILSWIEAALEACGTFMPCHKALDVSWRHEEEKRERIEGFQSKASN